MTTHPNVFQSMDMTGSYDAEILARFHTTRQLDSFVKKLQKDEDVEATSTRLILNMYKEKEIK